MSKGKMCALTKGEPCEAAVHSGDTKESTASNMVVGWRGVRVHAVRMAVPQIFYGPRGLLF